MSGTPPPQEHGEELDSPQPYKIHVASKYLDLTSQKFDIARLPGDFEQPEGKEWADGTPKRVVEELVDHWKEKFDWRKQESILNGLPNFRAPIEVDDFGTLGIHFVWHKSSRRDAIPLLLVHGWPGSFWEFSKVSEPLSNPADDGDPAFHVVVPSLPGYAFSDGVKKPGFGLEKMAETLDGLMRKLGYEHYVAQGGDWGYFICRCLALQYPRNVRAVHTNLLLTNSPSLTWHPLKLLKLIVSVASNSSFPGSYSAEEMADLKAVESFMAKEAGYMNIHKTKPLTISYGLTDSPVALLAWIREKMHSWTDNYQWTNDEVLTWFMLYWTPGPHQGIRLYKEALGGDPSTVMGKWSPVPLGYSCFQKEILRMPKDFAGMLHPVKFYKRHNEGGHFAAYERPEEFTTDLREFFGDIAAKDEKLQTLATDPIV